MRGAWPFTKRESSSSIGRMRGASDAELVAAIARGDAAAHAAESELCRRFAPRIRLYGLRHLRDEERARDLTQHVLLSVLEALRAQRVDDPARLDRFVLGTCRNVAQRLREREQRTPLADAASLERLHVEPMRMELRPLYACLSQLEARARAILMLSFVEERSADEIATALHLQASNVRVIRHRALHAVRNCLDAGGGVSP